MRIQTKILLGILPVVAGAIVVVGAVSLHLSTEPIREQIRQNATSTSEGYADQLQTRLVHHRREVRSIAAELAASGDAERTFRDETRYYPTFRHLAFIEAGDGHLRNSVPSLAPGRHSSIRNAQYWRRAVTSESATFSTINSDFGYRAVVISVPVRPGGSGSEPTGVVAATIPSDVLFAQLTTGVVGDEGYVVVFDRQTEIVTPDTVRNAEQRRLRSALDADGGRLARRLTSREHGWVSLPGSEGRFLAFAQVPTTGWRVALHGRLEALTGAIDRLRFLLILVLGASILVAAGVVYIGVRKTVEPIRELTRLIGRVQQGDLDVEFDVGTDDEIARLGEAFNSMTDELLEHRDRLEERVDERTKQVEEMNDELREQIAERREAEQAFRESQARYRTIVEECVEGIYFADPETWELVDANPAFFEILGYEESDLQDLTVGDVIDLPEDEIDEALETIIEEGELAAREGQWRRKDGSCVDVRVTASYIEEGERDLAFVIGRDITEQKRIQSQLELTNRLASLGTLAAGIAHEINNPLSYILTNLYFLEEELDRFDRAGAFPDETETDELMEVIQQSKRGADRVQNIVDDLRSFYRSEEKEIDRVDIAPILDSVVALAGSELPESVEVVQDYDQTPPVEADEGALKQVFLNIVVNAIQALPDDRSGPADTIAIEAHQEEEEVVVEIRDTGEGIRPEHRDRIFDPFFTTKSVDEGTGLGLSMSLNIVKSFGGEINVESEVQTGTTFTVVLPLAGSSDLSAKTVPFT